MAHLAETGSCSYEQYSILYFEHLLSLRESVILYVLDKWYLCYQAIVKTVGTEFPVGSLVENISYMLSQFKCGRIKCPAGL